MKKLTKILFLTIAFFMFMHNSSAKTNYLDFSDNKTAVKLHLKTDTIEKDIELKEIINYNGTVPIYSLDVTKTFKIGDYTEYYNESHVPVKDLEEKWIDLRNIAYFGQQYRDRTDIKWYIAAQYLIWELMLDNSSELYFIDANNNPILLFEEEIEIIKQDIANLKKLPSFAHSELGEFDFTIKKDNSLTIEDKNNILNEFVITGENSENFIRNNNFLTLKYNTYGDKIIFLHKPGEPNLNMSKIYYLDDTAPAYISRGTITLAGGIIQVNVVKPSLTIEITSDATTNLSLAGFSYELYQESNSLGNFTSDESGIINIPNLLPGTYFLKPVFTPYGYLPNNEVIEITIIDDDITINLIEKTIKKNIYITSIFPINNEVTPNYIIKNIDTLEEIITSNDEISLPYGNYIIKENLASSDYLSLDPIKFTIDNNDNNLNFNFTYEFNKKEDLIPPKPEIPNKSDKDDKDNKYDNTPEKPEIPIKNPGKKPTASVKNPNPSNTNKNEINTENTDNKTPSINVSDEISTIDKTDKNNSDLIISIPSTGKDNKLYLSLIITSFILSYGILKKSF